MKRCIAGVLFTVTVFAQGGFRGPGQYELYSPLSRKVLDMDRNDRRTILQFESRRTDNQTWDVVDAGGGYFYLRNLMNGFALAVQDDRNSTPLVAEPFNNSARQQWRFESGPETTAILVNRNGKAIDIPNGNRENGTKVNSYNRSGEENQRWQLRAANIGSDIRYGRSAATAGGASRYDTPAAIGGQRDADGVYFDDREQTYRMDGDGVCFYRERAFRGEAVCATVRTGRRRWNSNISDIGSVRFFGRAAAVQIFDREEFRGNAIEITGDEPNFQRVVRTNLRSAPQSLRVY